MAEPDGSKDTREKVLLWVGIGVLAIWGIAVLVQVILPSHQVPNAVTIVALPVATALFGSAYFTGRRPPKNEDEGG